MAPQYDKKKLKEIAEQYNLRFVILHGSHATGKARQDSDIDIAVAPHGLNENILELYPEMSRIFRASLESARIDLKSLTGADPLFRYEVVRNGALLFGDEVDYEEYKAVSRRMYDDARPLFELENILVHRYQEHLNSLYAQS